MQNVNNGINKPAKFSKRLLSGFIELFIVGVITYLLFTFVATPIANNAFDLDAKRTELANKTEEYYLIAKEDQYNILESYERDGNDFTLVYNDDFKNADKEKQQEMLKPFNEDKRVKELVIVINDINGDINGTVNIMFIVCVTIPEVIFWLVIPLTNKKRKSVGMMINKLEIIHRDDLNVTNAQIVKRFLSLWLLQTVIFYFIFGLSVLYISALISVMVMYMSINRYAVHDLIAKTKIVDEDPILFRDLEDKDNYLNFNRRRKQGVIDAETSEVAEETVVEAIEVQQEGETNAE